MRVPAAITGEFHRLGTAVREKRMTVEQALKEIAQICIDRHEHFGLMLAPIETVAPSAVATTLAGVEDALWALHSYESNRDDGRVYSEKEIAEMVAAVSAVQSATQRRSESGELWLGENDYREILTEVEAMHIGGDLGKRITAMLDGERATDGDRG